MQEITMMPGRMHGLAHVHSWRGWLALSLLSVGGRLISWAWQVAPDERPKATRAELEFRCDANAAGGMLYSDGQLVGTLPGVRRL